MIISPHSVARYPPPGAAWHLWWLAKIADCNNNDTLSSRKGKSGCYTPIRITLEIGHIGRVTLVKPMLVMQALLNQRGEGTNLHLIKAELVANGLHSIF
jgi:hypothetical protein